MPHPPRRAPDQLLGKESRSHSGIVHSKLDVKSWMQRLPLVDEARPGRCPSCDAPSRPPGQRLAIVGHGLRDRQQLGPAAVGAAAAMLVLPIRRYRCGPCGAVIAVVPHGIVARRHYSASAIVLAMALFGVERLAPRAVRAAVSPWQIIGETAFAGWTALRRWISAVRARTLLRETRRASPGASARQVAEHVTMTAAAFAAPSMRHLPLLEQAFAGGAHMK